jgi:hypothetical protein
MKNHRRMGHGFRFLLPLFSITPLFSKFSYKSFLFPNRGERYGAKYENGVGYRLSYTVSVEKLWTQNTRIIHELPYTFLSVGSPFIEEEGKMPLSHSIAVLSFFFLCFFFIYLFINFF